MNRNHIGIYYDCTYSDYNWRIEIEFQNSHVFPFAEKFNLSYTEFKRIMCYNSDCLFDLQLFGFKTQNDALKSIGNLCRYARGDSHEFS